MLKRLNVFMIIGLLFFVVACNSDEDTNTNEIADVENFVDDSMEELGKRGNFGRKGCFELVYPIEVVFEDESTITANDHTELKDAIKAWREANPEATKRPSFTFPIEIMNKRGELISVDDADEMKAIAHLCKPKGHGPNGHGRKACFKLVFPISIDFPDGTQDTYENPRAMKKALRAYKRTHTATDERPTFAFPITVVDKDKEETIVNSKEDLKAMKDACQGG